MTDFVTSMKVSTSCGFLSFLLRITMQGVKKLSLDGMDMTLEDALTYERKLFDGLYSSQERVDRMAVFLEKENRDPEPR